MVRPNGCTSVPVGAKTIHRPLSFAGDKNLLPVVIVITITVVILVSVFVIVIYRRKR